MNLLNDPGFPLSFIQSLQITFDIAAPLSILILGLFTGMRHALDADHIAAISSIIASGKDMKFHKVPVLGAIWGLGHTIALLFIGMIVLLLAISIPEEVSDSLEFGVGLMLIYLALTTITGFNIVKLLKGILNTNQLHTHPHLHPELNVIHNHAHIHEKNHHHEHKSLIIGIVHGMAGSGALMLIVLSTINSITLGFMYISIFGIGSILSMAFLSTLIGIPFLKARSSKKIYCLLRYGTSIITLSTGILLITELFFL